ncbi:MAG TPA: DUF1338 family protein [Bordetella sp.]|nr:DUF1338 family protein [Bordetella sp.]
MNSSALYQLLAYVLGENDAESVVSKVFVDDRILQRPVRGNVDRATIAQGLCLSLFFDLLRRVPSAKRYVNEFVEPKQKIVFDHGAVRTVKLEGMGGLPAGEEAILRLLRPLGFVMRGTYPLPGLHIVGRSYAHAEFPETMPQFFISEILLENFSDRFKETAVRAFSASRDPITPELRLALETLETKGSLPFHDAANVVLFGTRCFDRQHEIPAEEDYRVLCAESLEMAWILSEGNAFNHATDRVSDLAALHKRLREAGYRIKPDIEVSKNGRVRQTALLADPVTRRFKDSNGETCERTVPGSFYEFIERASYSENGESRPDLSFDSSNATGIFHMTAGAGLSGV